MIQIRRNVFETNSSSTHSLTMCTKEDYVKFSKKEYFLVNWRSAPKTMMTFDEALQFLVAKNIMDVDAKETVTEMFNKGDIEGVEDYLYDYDVYTYDTYDSDDHEDFYDEFTTPGGEVICAFGHYGYDG